MPVRMDRITLRNAGTLALFAAALAACGARSSLAEAVHRHTAPGGGTGGAGGAPTTSASATGGGTTGGGTTTGSGVGVGGGGIGGGGVGGSGALLACGSLVAQADVITLDAPGIDARHPTLAEAPGLQKAVLAFADVPVAVDELPLIRDTVFEPWFAWPPSIPDTKLLKTYGYYPATLFEVSPIEMPAPGFTLLYRADPSPWFGLAVDPLAKTAPNYTELEGDSIVFQSASGDRKHSLTFLGTAGEVHGANAHASGFQGSLHIYTVACASTPILGAAVGAGPGWMVAFTSGAPPKWDHKSYPCAQKFKNAGAATVLFPGTVGVEGDPFVQADPIDLGEPATRIKMAPRTDGAWLAYGTGSFPLRVGRLDPGGHVKAAPAPIAGIAAADSFVLTTIDDDLVLATVDDASASGTQITVRRIDTAGAITWSTTLDVTGALDGEPSIMSATGRGVVVAWSELPAGAAGHRIRIARLDCQGAP